jgi:pheromone shutdown-related protein TraB
MKIETVSDTLHRLYLEDGTEIILIGTAHVSKTSAEEVRATIEEENPDRICIELDGQRLKSKTDRDTYENMDIRKVIKDGKGFFLLANTALAGFQKRMGAQTGTQPGEEILSAARIANEKNIPLSLCDREIQTTFKRAWRKSSFWNKCKLLATLISAAFSNEKITEEELEALKSEDTLGQMMQEMAKELPTVKEVLIDERDRYLGLSIFAAPGKKKVAVIGAGHTNGVIATIEACEKGNPPTTTEKLSQVPKSKPIGKILGYAIPIAIVLIILYGALTQGWQQGLNLFLMWVACCCASTLIGCLASFAHPINTLCCVLTAPFFALNPVLGVGMLGGMLEATFRKPKVKDFETMVDMAGKFTGWYKNRILHPLLIFFLSSLGSSLGTLVAFPVLLTKLGK